MSLATPNLAGLTNTPVALPLSPVPADVPTIADYVRSLQAGASQPASGQALANCYLVLLPNGQSAIVTHAPGAQATDLRPVTAGFQEPGALTGRVLHPSDGPRSTAKLTGIKLCRRCNQEKPYNCFYRSKATTDGLDGRCKQCDAIVSKERRKKNKRVKVPTVEVKVCRACGLQKAANNYYRNCTNQDGLYNVCKACFTEKNRDRRRRNGTMPPTNCEWRSASDLCCIIYEEMP